MVDPRVRAPRTAYDAAPIQDLSGDDQGRVDRHARIDGELREKDLRVSDSASGEEEVASTSEVLVDQTGRPLGKRALQTRQRILDATVAELSSKSMRDLRVIDIARRVGSSPATFYQYFKDIEDAVLQLAEQAAQRKRITVDSLVGDWYGDDGYERLRVLIRRTIEHWTEFGPVLSIRNNASDEGDERFTDVRVRDIMPLMNTFEDQIRESQKRSRAPGQGGDEAGSDSHSDAESESETVRGQIEPYTGGMLAFIVLDRLGMYRDFALDEGVSLDDLVDTGATVLQFILTSKS